MSLNHPSQDELLLAKQVLETESQAILAAKDRLDERFCQAVDVLANSVRTGGKIVVTGVGKSGKIASKIAATLASLGAPALYLHPTEGAHGDLGVVSPKDTLLTLSYSGSSEEILRLFPRVRALGIKIISIVGKIKSPIAQQSDFTLDGSVNQEAGPLNLAPTSSTTVALALGDAIAVALSVRFDFKEEDFAENHPGGALGKRLTLHVSDLMKKGAEMPWVAGSANMDVVLAEITDKKLGAVLVRDKNSSEKIAGIITDGDLRRALKHKESFFTLTADQVMTPSPISIPPTAKAIQALELMENRPSQISVLPVLDDKFRCVGLVRLHDLIGRL